MNWSEERHGADKGYRADGVYVGVSKRKFWRVWKQGADGGWSPSGPAFIDARLAKAHAEAAP
jgi:hypothetical protein